MAISTGGRNLVLELGGWMLALGVGAFTILHHNDIRAFGRSVMGLPETTAAARPDPRTPAKPASVDEVEPRGRAVVLTAGSYGHFHADAEINGRRVGVMVDTGASMVALTYEDAERAGIAPRPSDFTHRSNTANGVARVAPVMLDSVAIGDIVIRDVRASVMERGKLGQTLLGMSFLGKLGRVEMRAGKLVLEE